MSFIKGSSRFGLGVGAPVCVVLAALPVSQEILRDDPVKLYRVIPARGQEEEQQLDDEVDRAVREGDLGSGDGLISRDGSDDIRGTLRERRILVFAFISSAAIGFIGAFLGRYAVELGEGQNLVGVLSAVSAASEIPILLVSSKLVRRFGEMNLLIFSCFMAALRLVLVGTGIVPVMICGQLLQSVSYMTVYYSCVTYIANHTYEDCRARGQSAFAMVQSGLSVVVANLFGGWACDALGTHAGFLAFALASTIAAVVAFVAYVLWRRSAAPQPEGQSAA